MRWIKFIFILLFLVSIVSCSTSRERVYRSSDYPKKTEKRDRTVKRDRSSKRVRTAKKSPSKKRVRPSKRVRTAKSTRPVRERTSTSKNSTTTYKTANTKSTNFIVQEAQTYLGTPYKYGGSTRSGLDCSGLVINVFDAANYKMPRASREQATVGQEINLRQAQEGDLVFFITSGSSINHVGIVDKVVKGEVYFIHSSTSKGVIVSSMEETYWNKRFVKATRVL